MKQMNGKEISKKNIECGEYAAVRINKYISDAGICSRREADRLIEAGKILIDGLPASTGQKVMPGQIVIYNGKIVKKSKEQIILAYNKPTGVECTSAADNPDNIIDKIGYPERIFPIGRLDKASTGLILLTNIGELVNEISKSANDHEKEYIVNTNRPISEDDMISLRKGIVLKDIPLHGKSIDIKTKKCNAWKSAENEFHIILTQGINRQIRRMCMALGYTVTSLHRIRIMDIELGTLPSGTYRKLTQEEINKLYMQISVKGS